MSATLINGEATDLVPVSDRAFQYGDGLFETVRIVRRQPTLWSMHLARLTAGCRFLQIPLDPDLLEAEFEHLLSCNEQTGIAKIIISRGPGGRGYQPPDMVEPLRVLQFFPLAKDFDEPGTRGVRTRFCNHTVSRNARLTRFKHLCRIDQVLASMDLSREYPEGIMLTDDNQVIEGTRSNLFFASAGELFTPSLEEAGIKGIMRDYLLRRFNAAGVEVKERQVGPRELTDASELFFCNSVFGIWPVTELLYQELTNRLPIGPFTNMAGEFVHDAFSLEI